MTIESENKQVLTDFLLEVTQAATFKELASAYKKISEDFEDLIKNDQEGKFTLFIERYNSLAKSAQKLLGKEANGKQPSADQIAIFGEMIILRDFCFRRLNI
ncbi:MAG TPA: hypothetical protein VMX55_14385 [candidate division Zixibacteria bacterium]|nr:hypothetical protein [candidate division Zixibacteria bacterium]